MNHPTTGKPPISVSHYRAGDRVPGSMRSDDLRDTDIKFGANVTVYGYADGSILVTAAAGRRELFHVAGNSVVGDARHGFYLAAPKGGSSEGETVEP